MTPFASRRPRTDLVVACVAPLLLACDGGPAVGPELAAPPVEIVRARAGALPEVERVDGLVRALDQVEIRPELAAPVAEVLVRSGDAVRRGQPLVRLRDDELAERLRQTEAAIRLAEAAESATLARLAEAEARSARTRALAAEGLSSAADRDRDEAELATARADAAEAAARVEQARATRDGQRAALARAVVRAPADGRVGEVAARVGALADPGTALFVMGDPRRLVVDVRFTESQMGRARAGQPVEISWPGAADGEPLAAELTRLSPFLAPGSFSAAGEIELAEAPAGLLPGMFVRVDLVTGAGREATLLPVSALHEDPASGELGVWRLVDGAPYAEPEAAAPAGEVGAAAVRVERVGVSLLAEHRGVAGVSGIAPGDWVVAIGQHLLAQDGRELARVRVASWARLLELQALQREDVLDRFLEKQRRLARQRAATGGP